MAIPQVCEPEAKQTSCAVAPRETLTARTTGYTADTASNLSLRSQTVFAIEACNVSKDARR